MAKAKPVEEIGPFEGFSPKTTAFFRELVRHNNRDWFEGHREIYDQQVLAPAKAFIVALGARMKPLVPGLAAIPRIDKSIFRIHKDTRFSLDPTPYKTNLALYFWESDLPRMETAGFYISLEPPNLMMGAGMYEIPKPLLERFRRAVTAPKSGRDLTKILEALKPLPGWELGGEHYKRIPAGYDAAHPNAALLKHNGLWIGRETKIPDEFYSPRFVDYCVEAFTPLIPFHRWLVALSARKI